MGAVAVSHPGYPVDIRIRNGVLIDAELVACAICRSAHHSLPVSKCEVAHRSMGRFRVLFRHEQSEPV
jgi:hypothetical protein